MFDIILNKVCEVCEVAESSVIGGSRMQSVVDARVLCVQYLRRIGLSNDDISLIVLRNTSGDPTQDEIKKKSKSIDKMFKSYSDRCL